MARCLFVNGNIFPFVAIADIAWNYSTAITKATSMQPVSYVLCTRATTTVTSHCSHSPTSETSLPFLHGYWVTMMLYNHCLCGACSACRG